MNDLKKRTQIELAWSGKGHWWDRRRFKDIKQRIKLCERQNWKCCYCGTKMQIEEQWRSDSATIEHVVPRSLGGPDGEANVVMACRPCNQARADKFLPVHFELLGMFERGELA